MNQYNANNDVKNRKKTELLALYFYIKARRRNKEQDNQKNV